MYTVGQAVLIDGFPYTIQQNIGGGDFIVAGGPRGRYAVNQRQMKPILKGGVVPSTPLEDLVTESTEEQSGEQVPTSDTDTEVPPITDKSGTSGDPEVPVSVTDEDQVNRDNVIFGEAIGDDPPEILVTTGQDMDPGDADNGNPTLASAETMVEGSSSSQLPTEDQTGSTKYIIDHIREALGEDAWPKFVAADTSARMIIAVRALTRVAGKLVALSPNDQKFVTEYAEASSN